MLKRVFKITLFVVIGLYLTLLTALWLGQRAMIYPNQGTKLAECTLPDGAKLWERGVFKAGPTLKGIFTSSNGNKLLIYMHGNAESACSWRYLGVNHAGPLGYDVLVMEYPGYAGTQGKISIQSNEQMVSALAIWLNEQSYDKTVLMGYSLGTGVASMLTKEINPDALILFAPYDRLANVVRDQAPFVPRFLVSEDYRSDLYLKNYHGPVTIVHGGVDPVILPERSQALAKHLHNVDRIVLEGKGHGGLFETAFFNRLLEDKLP